MKKVISLWVLFLVFSSVAFAQDFEVTGIINEKEPVAIINGKILKAGDEIEGAVVQKIEDKTVVLKFKGEIILKNVSGKRLPKDIADIDLKIRNKKVSRVNLILFISALILILGGGGFYLSGKSKKAQNKISNEDDLRGE